MQFQQFTGPVMAKAVEDTAFYRYLRLVSLNEVGGEPQHFGTSPAAFHAASQQTLRCPSADHAGERHPRPQARRGRARAHQRVERAAAGMAPARPPLCACSIARGARRSRAGGVPSRNDEYLLYQTLLGAWPLEVLAPEDLAASDFAERIVAYMIKALREAKLETSWTAPDAAYEDGVAQFVRRILDPVSGRAFIADLLPFADQIARIGAVNGLAQTLLKLTVPGVPDSYQGTELWDLSLVDPDNRRPVDFELRSRWLAEPRPAFELVRDWRSGRIKQQLIARTLALRQRQPALFRDGDYLPLAPAGAHAERIVAFARRSDQRLAIVIVPRLVTPLLRDSELPLPPAVAWEDSEVELAEGASGPLLDELTGRQHALPPSGRLAIAEVLAELPVALLSATAAT